MTKQPTQFHDQAPTRFADAVLRTLARTILSAFFRNVEIVGESAFPKSGPVIVVSNHLNGLMDGVILTACLPRAPRLLAASSIWQIKILLPLLSAGGVIPVFRPSEVSDASAQNEGTFSRVHEFMKSGGVLAMFPEGVSHSEASLRRLKTGAARIALNAGNLHYSVEIRIVPVGLIFDSKAKFRSRLLIQIGKPIDTQNSLKAYSAGNDAVRIECVRQLTQQITLGLAEVTPNYETWEEARLVGRAADLWVQPQPDLPTKPMLSSSFETRRAFAAGYSELQKRYPERLAMFRSDLAQYDALLLAAGLRDEHVGARYQFNAVIEFVLKTIVTLAIRLPVAAIGILLNFAPYFVSKLIGRFQMLDKKATWSVFSSIVLFPGFWVAEAIAAGILASVWWDRGWQAGLAVLVAAPITGQLSLVFFDVFRRLANETRAWLKLRFQRKLNHKLVLARGELQKELAELVALSEAEQE